MAEASGDHSTAAPDVWEYHVEMVDVGGLFGPTINTVAVHMLLNRAGADGWELVNTVDVNRGHGSTSALLLFFKRRRI